MPRAGWEQFRSEIPQACVLSGQEPALALEWWKVFGAGPHPLVIEIEGRKGTRLYTSDESVDYGTLVEGQEKAAATHEPTTHERVDQCMASWDAKTHITKASWRQICEREIKNNE